MEICTPQPSPDGARRQRHDDRTQYVACVLWLIGCQRSTIAKVLNLRRSQVGGIIDRSEYADRFSMTIAERQAKLKELEDLRFSDGEALDGGLLDNVPFKVL
ncbi:MAG: hypothetical protein K0M55_15835 [Rhizobium sp.]|nr:hypothetical protein [Rhizobium sp.]MBW8319268.1 hypothetical protein [Rhizobium sp.]